MEKFKVLNGWHLKLIAFSFMVLNHLEYLNNFGSEELIHIFLISSRFVAPLFAFLLVEGVLHTKNLKKYCIRIFIWMVIVTSGNYIMNTILVYLANGRIATDDLFF